MCKMSQQLNMPLLISTIASKPNRLFSALRLFFQNLCSVSTPAQPGVTAAPAKVSNAYGDGAAHSLLLLPCPPFSCRFEYLFNFDSMFEIHDDIEVLKRMGMACGLEVGKCSPEDLKVARSLVPKALEPYVIGQCTVTACSFYPTSF